MSFEKAFSCKNILIFLVSISFILRIWYIDWGLPNLYQHDETNHIEQALQVGAGKLEPDGLMHGTFITYLLFFEYGILYILGKITGKYVSLNDFLLSYLTDPTIFFIIGRVTIVLLSIGSIFFTYLIGKKLFNERVGVISALFIAFSPTHFIQSTTVKDDIPAAFFCALFFYFISIFFMHETPMFQRDTKNDENNPPSPPFSKGGMGGFSVKRNRFYYASGFALGLAIAAKLTAIPGIITFCLAFILREIAKSKGYRKYLVSLIDIRFLKGMFFIFIGFFIAEPFAVINYEKFIWGILDMKNQYAGMVTTINFPQLFYFTNHFPNMLGIPLTIFFCISVIYFVFRPSKKLVLLLSFPVSYYLLFNNAVGFSHFILTALPFIAIIAAAFLDKISYMACNKWKASSHWVIMLPLAALLLVPELFNCIRYLYVLGSEDTRTLSRKWIENNIESNASIFIDGTVNNLVYFSPQVKGNLETLRDDLNYVRATGGSGRLQKMLIDNFKENDKTYRLYKSSHIKPEQVYKFNADYVITSGFLDLDVGEFEYFRDEEYYKQRKILYEEIAKRYELIKRFEPFPNFRYYFPLFTSKDYSELRRIELFSNQKKIMPGPEIKIFKRKI